VYPTLTLRSVLLMLFFGVLPPCLHVFLWSRVTTVSCAPSGQVMACDIDERTLVGRDHRHIELRDPRRATMVTLLEGNSRAARIEVETADGSVRLTRDREEGMEHQRELAVELTDFFHRPAGSRFHRSFGSRWATLPIALFTVAIAIAIWLLFGQSLTFERRGSPIALAVETRRWPLRGRRLSFELQEVEDIEVSGQASTTGRFRERGPHLVLRLTGEERMPLCQVSGQRAKKVAQRVRAFLNDAREGHG